jgi:hypothetical protein
VLKRELIGLMSLLCFITSAPIKSLATSSSIRPKIRVLNGKTRRSVTEATGLRPGQESSSRGAPSLAYRQAV